MKSERIGELAKCLKKRRIDIALVRSEANLKALAGIDCDNGLLTVASSGEVRFYTDFRYIPAVKRTAPWLKVADLKKFKAPKVGRVGYESTISAARYLAMAKNFKGAKMVDVTADINAIRSVKTVEELDKLRAAEALNDKIWAKAQKTFKPGMTEKEMARTIQHLMIDMGDGEAFATIVCVGKNAAECHHIPDDTVWDGKEPVLVDMGVKLNGYCSDMTRNIVPREATKEYRKIYDLVLEANMLGIKNAKSGITSGKLDAIVRKFLASKGYKKEFGHSLGHGVGVEIHEAPAAAKKQKTVLKPGMSVTIEPGIYIEGKLGVRIEDLVLITKDGCEVISHSAK